MRFRSCPGWLVGLALCLWAGGFSAGAAQNAQPPAGSGWSTPDFANQEPLAPLPSALVVNPAKVTLGERLFYDTRLSRDQTMSCATCHPLDRGGVDGLARAKTPNGSVLSRNTPTIFNLAFSFYFNWDGSADTLEAHADRLLRNPDIMNMDWATILTRIGADSDLKAMFRAAYPEGLTQINVLDALANFERSLITPNARFDRYLRGDRQALTAQEQRGYQLFKSYGCVACHQGTNIGGNLFQRFGIFKTAPGPSNPGALNPAQDLGRYQVTRIERDRGVFRVPSLRNVAVTAPYFHDGGTPTLELAVSTMARVQLGKTLAPEDIQSIVQFLHTLTGEYHGQPLAIPPTSP